MAGWLGRLLALTLWQIFFMVVSSRSAFSSRLLTVSFSSSSPGAFFTMLMSGSSSELSSAVSEVRGQESGVRGVRAGASPVLGLLLLLSAFLVLAAGFFLLV